MSIIPSRLRYGQARRMAFSAGNADMKQLFEAILGLETQTECAEFFIDLCTPGELSAVADRWKVARLLNQGMPYREIYEKTGISTATITRVARALYQGEGGYRKALDKIKAKRKP